MSNYYKERNRAIRTADHLINEALYIKEEAIDLRLLELKVSPKFNCNFMKIFKERLDLHYEGDKRITEKEGLVYIEKESEK